MKKRFLAILLAIVICLAMAAPALAAGETTIIHETGIGFDLSKPLLGTSTTQFAAPNDNVYTVPVYGIPDGTIVVPKMIGTIPVETGRKLAEKMGDTSEEPGIGFDLKMCLFDWSGQGANTDIDAAGYTFKADSPDALMYSRNGRFMIECELIISPPKPEYDNSSYVHGNGAPSSYWVRTYIAFEIVDESPSYPVLPEQPTATLPTVENIPATGTAVATTQTVKLDGKDMSFQYYAVKDANGNLTNYVKVRDLANALNGTKAQFNVGWNGKISITSNTAYEVKGGEGTTPYSGNQSYTAVSDTPVSFNGSDVNLTSFQLFDSKGNGYTYYKLRDLGQLLNFYVDWDGAVVIDTGRPYNG